MAVSQRWVGAPPWPAESDVVSQLFERFYDRKGPRDSFKDEWSKMKPEERRILESQRDEVHDRMLGNFKSMPPQLMLIFRLFAHVHSVTSGRALKDNFVCLSLLIERHRFCVFFFFLIEYVLFAEMLLQRPLVKQSLISWSSLNQLSDQDLQYMQDQAAQRFDKIMANLQSMPRAMVLTIRYKVVLVGSFRSSTFIRF